jgi:salicylate hydroxylase
MKNLKDIKCFPIFVSSEIYQPTNKRIFLIGDAFFAFPPTFAQGASQSIEIAHELYKNFQNENNEFNNKRIKRTKMIDKKSKLNYFAFHISNPLVSFVRNMIMKQLVKNKKFLKSYLGKIYNG